MDALWIADTAYGGDNVTNIESMKQEASELIGDDSGEFGKALVDRFPVEDGMPDSSDVRDFMNSWVDRECYDDAVTLMCTIVHGVHLCDRFHTHSDTENNGEHRKQCLIELTAWMQNHKAAIDQGIKRKAFMSSMCDSVSDE